MALGKKAWRWIKRAWRGTIVKVARGNTSNIVNNFNDSILMFQFTFRDLVKIPELKKPLIISLVMHLSQQFSGINAVSTFNHQSSHAFISIILRN